MPGTSFDSDSDFDPQDQAETFDESMTVGGEGDVSLGGESPVTPGEDMRTFEEMPDVYDVTSRAGDRDRDEGLALDADEFDPDAIGKYHGGSDRLCHRSARSRVASPGPDL